MNGGWLFMRTWRAPADWRLPLLLSLLLGILLSSACAPRRPPPPPIPIGMDQVLLQLLEEQRHAFHALEGMARVRLLSEGRSQSSSQVLFAQSPDRFRSEVLSPFGQPLLVIAADGRQLRVLVPGEGRFYLGEASAENLLRFTRIPLGFETLVPILLYQVPVLPHDDRVVYHGQGGGYRLTLFLAGERRQECDFDSDLRLTGATYLLDDEPLLRIGYGRFADHGQPFPQQISLEIPGESEVLLNFSDLRTNIDIPAERFLLKAPPGTEVLPFP
jgi:outer membrane lipoprotein-sorting protein